MEKTDSTHPGEGKVVGLSLAILLSNIFWVMIAIT